MYENQLVDLAKNLTPGDPLNFAMRRMGRLYAQVQNTGQTILLASQCYQHRLIVNVANIGVGLAHLDVLVANASGTRDLLGVVREGISAIERILVGLNEILTFITSDETKEEWQLVRKISIAIADEDVLVSAIEKLADRTDLTPLGVQNLTKQYKSRIDGIVHRREALQDAQRKLLVARGVSPEAMDAELERLMKERDEWKAKRAHCAS